MTETSRARRRAGSSESATARHPLLIGTAGWTVPREEAEAFPGEGTHLQRYARRLSAAEINSSFHRRHRPSTYARWAESVPDGFRFSVKLPKTITHAARLADAEALTDGFLEEVSALGPALGCLLVQLPPSLAFEAAVARRFLERLREHHGGGIACEPRHASWLEPDADALLRDLRIARVAADPDRPSGAGEPGGWSGLRYHRLHGSPRIYHSSYPAEQLERLAERLARERAEGAEVWCIFDNTTRGAATANALDLSRLTGTDPDHPPTG